MNIIVTGCAGYIGQVLWPKLLQAGHNVVGLDNLMYGQPTPCFTGEISKGSFRFRREPALSRFFDQGLKIDAIIHLAAIVGAPACDQKPMAAFSANLMSVRDILRWRPDYPKPLLIYPNTNSMYGSNEGVCTEDTPGNPLSLYAKTKCLAEDFIRSCYPNHIVFRLATAFGPSRRMRHDLMVNDFIAQACFNGLVRVWEPEARRNFVHVEDVADAFIFALGKADVMRGQVYNLGNDVLNMTKGELAEVIASHFEGCRVEACTGTDSDKRDYIVSNEKLRAVGFEAKRGIGESIPSIVRELKQTQNIWWTRNVVQTSVVKDDQ